MPSPLRPEELRVAQPTIVTIETSSLVSENIQSTTSVSRQRSIASVVALVICACFAVIQLSKWPERLRYPGEEDAAEGTQLSEMVHLRRGVQIYRVPADGEFDGAVYGPLCYLLGAAVINPDRPSYLPLRLLSLLGTMGLIVVSASFVFRLTKSGIGAALAALLLLGSAYIGRYGISARADMVALLLAFTGFFVFFNNQDSRRALALAAGLMLLSLFYKQQFIGAPLAAFSFLVITARFRRALEFVLMMGGGGLALAAVFSFVVFPHQAFLLHFIVFNHLPFDKSLIVPEILMFVIPLFVPLLGSADFVDHHSDKLIACYAVVSSAGYFLLLFSSGSGADTNRCLEAVVVLSCLFAARITTAESFFSGIAWTGALAFTLGLVALMGSAFVVPRVSAQDFTADKALQTYLHDNFAPGTPVLSYYPADPLRAGLAVPVTNWWHYSALIRKGLLSDHDIVARIEHGDYGAILLDFDIARKDTIESQRKANFYTTTNVRTAVLKSYRQIGEVILPSPELTRFNDKRLYVWSPIRAIPR